VKFFEFPDLKLQTGTPTLFPMNPLLPALAAAGLGLAVSDFEALHEQLQPGSDEAWRTIPWRLSLLDAQAAAAEEGKPIFIWAMDGHPLGCV